MNSMVRRKLDMASRVREFTRAHAGSDPGYPTVLARLDELLPRAEAIAARQYQGRVAARGPQAGRMELRRALHSQLMHYLVAVGSFAAKDQAELSERFKLPDINATNQAFLTSVKALLAAAEGQRDLLAKQGLVLASLDEIRRMVADLNFPLKIVVGPARSHRRPGRSRGDCHRAGGAGQGARRDHPLSVRQGSRSDGRVEGGPAVAGAAAERGHTRDEARCGQAVGVRGGEGGKGGRGEWGCGPLPLLPWCVA